MEIILGAVVSLVMQVIKTYVPGGEYVKLGVLAILSILAAAVYTFFVSIGVWETAATVLITAGAFYTFVIQRFTSN